MQFSSGPYYSPMDRESHDSQGVQPKIEKPIIPINELGVTVVEKDPVTGGHIIQNVDAAIRQGASKMQIVMSTPHTQAMGGRPKAYGKEVRENLRELQLANNVKIEGLEMPTSSMSSLSGFDPQRQSISEEKRQTDLQEVKDAIRFIGDISGGGGVDIFSQEFHRNIIDAKWNQKGKYKGLFEAYEGEDLLAKEYLVDTKTGQITGEIRHSTDFFEPVYRKADSDFMGKDVNNNEVHIQKGDFLTHDNRMIDPTKPDQLIHRVPKWSEEKKSFDIQQITWQDVVKRTGDFNKRHEQDYTPAEFAFRLQMDNKWIQQKGHSLYYTKHLRDQEKRRDAYKDALVYYEKVESSMSDEDLDTIKRQDPLFAGSPFLPSTFKKPTELIRETLASLDHDLQHMYESSAAADAQATETLMSMERMQSLEKFALKSAVKSYAEAGLFAMDETKNNRHVERPIHVGPELGWPGAYGGHPDEFIDLIKKSRKEMADDLVKDRGFSKSDAAVAAKKHISGCFDTSHLGMWINHFPKDHPRETEDERLVRFNNWYLEMVDRMQKEDVIGSIQAVDSATGAHGHLPAGQGIFPVVEAVDRLRAKGFSGFIVSEGHEEEQFTKGRLLLETWRAFGADIAGSYFAPQRTTWSDVSETYFGHSNPPPYVVGAYRPTEDWVFWSGMPLE
ncbi:hypothetical protein HQ545_04400 [Candidatus Woesearchaeota archaeon]|nr:hypothetical protein [Candidatus Woesearchaeota archaeon]